uniref:TBC1 domain family member 23 n=1 Tax=Steinernema glaseri TaxID=37863 RepID=A0A1I7ZB02_9BILA
MTTTANEEFDVSSGSVLSDDWVCDNEGASKELATHAQSSDSNNEASAADAFYCVRSKRCEKWVNALGVRNKADPLMDWDQLYNLKNQAELRKHCRSVCDRVGDIISVPELESLVTLYCKKQGLEFTTDNGWIELLEVLISVGFDASTLYNIFFAITTKYVPRDLSPKAKVYDLFRLILQYHDPELCTHLESVKCTPHSYAHDWFSTLLAKSSTANVLSVVWDCYFDKGDPFLIFFMILVLLVNARDSIMGMKNEENQLRDFIVSLPKQLSEEDVPDFMDLAEYYSQRTPMSIREKFHFVLFGSNLVSEGSDVDLSKTLCLVVSVQELVKRIGPISAAKHEYSYFIIDSRDQSEFINGNIPGSFNLCCRLFVDEPDQFHIAVDSLESFKKSVRPDDHICFVGRGDEELDSYMMMVIAKFLQLDKRYVSLLEGGYKALHTFLKESDNLSVLANHNPQTCEECVGASDRKESTASGMWSVMTKVKETMNKISVRDKNRKLSQDSVGHVVSTDRHAKRYRNMPSIFSIEDSISSEEDYEFPEMDAPNDSEKLKWTDFRSQPEIIDSFEGHELTANRTTMKKCHIAISRTHMHILHALVDSPEYVVTKARLPLSTVMQVTSKKKVPEFLTFKFGYELPTGEIHISAVHRFLLSKSGECAKAVKSAIIALRPFNDDGPEDP